jgi:hypothetical protein
LQNQGQRLKEGAAINRSLLALGNVINALSAANGRRTFVNFRDSKLTRLLKDSLAGSAEGARTVLIAHVTPSSLHYDETFNTLTWRRGKGNGTLFGHVQIRESGETHRFAGNYSIKLALAFLSPLPSSAVPAAPEAGLRRPFLLRRAHYPAA